jgi:uncharacterized protein involved in exopolysaccharide biosynthesis
MSMITTLNTQLDAATQQLGRAQQDRTYLSSMLAQQEAQWKQMQAQSAQGTPIATPHDLEQQIASLQANLTALESRYTDEYPDVVKTKAQLTALQKKLDASKVAPTTTATEEPKERASLPVPKELLQLRLQAKMLDDNIKNKAMEQTRLQGEVRKYEAKLQLAPAVEEQYKGLTRDHDTALQFYTNLLAKKSESEMATDLEKRQQGEQFKVMDPPNLPERPTFPNRPAFAMGGGAAGLALGVGIAFLLEVKEKVIRSERDVEVLLQLPTLVAVPWVGMDSLDEAEDRIPRWKFWKRRKAAKVEHDLVGA